MRNALMIVSMIVLVAGVAFAQDTADEKASSKEQVKVEGPFRATYVLPSADITKYSKLYPWKARYEFREGGETKGAETSTETLLGGGGPYTIREESKQKFGEIVNQSVVKELGRSKIFEIVDKIEPGTLLIRGSVLDIVSGVPPNYTGPTEIYLTSVGQATFVFELIDAETGEVQATVGERRWIQKPTQRSIGVSATTADAPSVWAEVEKAATGMARDLRKALEDAYKKATK
jgi:hypothetical protein